MLRVGAERRVEHFEAEQAVEVPPEEAARPGVVLEAYGVQRGVRVVRQQRIRAERVEEVLPVPARVDLALDLGRVAEAQVAVPGVRGRVGRGTWG